MSQLVMPLPHTAPPVATVTLNLAFQAQAQVALAHCLAQQGFSGLRLMGPAGAGKSFLLKQAAVAHAGVFTTNPAQAELFTTNIFALDDMDKTDMQAQEAAFHLFNHLQKTGGKLLVSHTAPLAETNMLPDLRSRLLLLNTVELPYPTDDDLRQLLQHWAARRQLNLSEQVVQYLLMHHTHDPAALERFFHALDAFSMQEKQGITIPLLKKIEDETYV